MEGIFIIELSQVIQNIKHLPDAPPAEEIMCIRENKEAEAAHGRESYKRVCSNISLFSKAGYTEQANELIWEFMQTYKRKPAFVDELKKIQGK